MVVYLEPDGDLFKSPNWLAFSDYLVADTLDFV